MAVIEQIQNHTIFNMMDTYIDAIELIEDDEEFLIGLSEYSILTINRCKSVFTHLKNRLDSIDPLLLRKATLDATQAECSAILSVLQSYQNYLNHEAQLNGINNRLDNVLANLISIPQLVDSSSVAGIKDTVISFRRAVGQHRKRMETLQEIFNSKIEENTDHVNDLNTSFNQLSGVFETKKSLFETEFSTLHTSFLEIEEEREHQFNDRIETLENKIDETLNDYKDRWESLHNDNSEIIEETVRKLQEHQENFLEETRKKQNDYDEILNEHKKSVESLVGIISTNSISGHFKEVADKKEKLTSQWQKTTLFGFLITIGFGIYAFIFTNQDLTWPSLIARFIVTTALGSFTAYAARQAAKNEAEEKSNRQMEVELKTLNPYIASFSDEDQIKLKEQLFPLIFGKATSPESQLDTTQNNTNQFQVSPQDVSNITNVIEVLKSFTNTNRGA